MPRFEFLDYENIKSASARRSHIFDFMEKCASDDAVYLSDLIARKDTAGGAVLAQLGERQADAMRDGFDTMKWKIKVLCDEWGNQLGPGDKIEKRIQLPLKDKKTGNMIKPREMSMAKLDGSYNKRFTRVKEFVVDNKGCITCGFEDAVSFLNLNGVHGMTGGTMTTKPQQSTEPLDCPNGQKLHKHHWRYKEVDADQYTALPKTKKRIEPLRGLATQNELDEWRDEQKIQKEIEKEQRIQDAKKDSNK